MVRVQIEVVPAQSPLTPPPRAGFVSPTVIEGLLSLLAQQAIDAAPPHAVPAPPARELARPRRATTRDTDLRGQFDDGTTFDEGGLPEDGFDLDLDDEDEHGLEQSDTVADGVVPGLSDPFGSVALGTPPNTDDDETVDSTHPGVPQLDDFELPEIHRMEPGDDSERQPRYATKVESLQDRLRGLPAAEQLRIARAGELTERVALERIYGKQVWEALLRNPKVTPPEVARLARMGTLPRPLLESIANNRAWLSSAQVRRALLSNRKLSHELVMTVLRATPKAELKLVPKQTAYPSTVRDAARTLLGGARI